MTGSSNQAFVRHRVAAGWTQETLIREYRVAAGRLGLSGALTVRTIARWEASDPPLPRATAQQILESLFGVPLEQLGFTVPETRRTPAVERRRFLEDAGGLAAAIAAPALTGAARPSAPAALRRESGRVDAGHLRAIDAAIEGVYLTDHAAGSGSAQSSALDLSSRITVLLSTGSYLEPVGRALQAALGQITAHLAWLGYDAGRLAEARGHCLEALHLARMTGDRQLETRALANLSLIALEQGRDWEARAAAEATWTAARGWADPTVRAMLAVRESGARAGTGDATGGRRALSQAVANFDRSADPQRAPRWARFFGPGELNQATAAYYLHAGRPASAVPFLQATLADLGDGYTRNAVAYRAKLALALLAAGELEAACAEADTVCAWLEHVDSGKVHTRLRRFRVQVEAVGGRTAGETIARIDHALGGRPECVSG